MLRVSLALGLLSALLGACAAPVARSPVDPLAGLAVEPAAGPVGDGDAAALAWPAASSCAAHLGQLVAMDAASARRLDPAASPLGVASLASPAVELGADLPLPRVAASALGAFDCAVVVGAALPLPTTVDRVLDQRTVQSAYPTGTKRRRNPEHQEVEKALAAARRGGAEEADILRTGDPLLDLIGTVGGGIISGIAAASTGRAVRTLEAELAATPAFIEDPILTPYRYALTEIEAERRFALPLALHDRALGLAWRTSVTLTERHRFALAPGRHGRDVEPSPAPEASLTTPAALTAWRQTVPQLTIRTLLTHLEAAVVAATPEVAPLATTLAALEAPAQGTPLASAVDGASRPGAQPAAPPGGDALPVAPPGGDALPAELLAHVDAIIGPPEPALGPPASNHGSREARQVRRPAAVADGDLLAVGSDGRPGFYVTSEHIVVPSEALGHSSLVLVRYPDGMRAHGLVEVVDDALGLALVYLPRRGTPLPRQRVASPAPLVSGTPGTPWRIDGAVGGLFVEDQETATRRWIDAVTLDAFVARLDAL